MAIKYFIARKLSDGAFKVMRGHAYDDLKTAKLNAKIFYGDARYWIVLEGSTDGIAWLCDRDNVARKVSKP